MRQQVFTALDLRHSILLLVIFGSLTFVLMLNPISQDASYHAFADTRSLVGIPNFLDVVSNLPFLLVGFLGLQFCFRRDIGPAKRAWVSFFAGVLMVGAGSAYYHLSPNNMTLVWDRLPMTIGFMGLLVALLSEHVSHRLGSVLLTPALLIGAATVLYWQWTDDLRPYVWVQFMPLVTVIILVFLFKSSYSHQWMLLVALSWYILAKIAETYDSTIFYATSEIISGHTIKHFLAAAGCYIVIVLIARRRPVAYRE